MFKNDNRNVLYMFLLLVILLAMCLLMEFIRSSAVAEDAYIICYPNDVVIVREKPKKTAFAISELLPGAVVHLDGKQRNGYLHCVDMNNETSDGWVSKRYVVDEQPIEMNIEAIVISKGRLAARKYIGGERIRWIKPQTDVMVYFYTEEWCVTDKGYIMTKYLEFD